MDEHFMDMQEDRDNSKANLTDINNLLVGIGLSAVFVDFQLRILHFTPAASTITNLIAADVGRLLTDIAPTLVGYSSLAFDVKAVLATLTPKELEVQTPEGHWYTLRIQPYRSLDAVLRGAVISFVNITEIVDTRRALERSQESLERAGTLAKVGGWEVNLQTMKLTWTQETFRIAEIDPPVEPPLEGSIDLFAPEARSTISASVQALIDSGTPYDLELPLIAANGRQKWVRTQGFGEMRGGKTVRIYGTFQDITERRQLEIALGEVTRELDDYFIGALDPFCIASPDGYVLKVNRAWTQTLGYELHELEGKGLFDLVHPDDLSQTAEAVGALNDSASVVEFINRCKHKDGSWRLIESRVQPRVNKIFAAARDITVRKRTEDELVRSLKDREALLKEVHHRVKNNLQVITSLLRLESRRSSVEETKAVLGDMQARIRAMALLHESLYRAGTFAAVDLGGYLRQLITQAFQAKSMHASSVQLQLDLGSVQVGMDQAISCGLLVNELISNCLKHGFPAGGPGHVSIDLQTLDTAQQWRLRVSDTGVGLPDDFEEKRKGSLGLQLVGDLARQIGGELVIAPNQEKGVAFTVNFRAIEPTPLVMPA